MLRSVFAEIYRIGKHWTFTKSWDDSQIVAQGKLKKLCKTSIRRTGGNCSNWPTQRWFLQSKEKHICIGGMRALTLKKACKWRGRMSHISALGVVWVWTQMTFFSTWTIWATFASKEECLEIARNQGESVPTYAHWNHTEWGNITRSKTHERHSILYPRPMKPPFPPLVRTMWGLVLPRHMGLFRHRETEKFTWQVCNKVLFWSHFCAS